MPIQIWLYAALVSLSVPVMWWALSGTRSVSPNVTKNLMGTKSSDLRVLKLEQPAAERILLPILKGFGAAFQKLTPVEWIKGYERNLGHAGKLGRWSPEQVVGAKVLATALAVGWGALRLLAEATPSRVFTASVIVLIAFFVPDLLLRSLADRRKEEIELELPDTLDQLTMSVEAGLSFEAALARIAVKNNKSVLSGEFARMLQDIQLGTPRADALTALGKRSGVDDLRHVVLSLRQAEQLGVPLAQTLRTIADQMRQKRAFRAEEKAHKLPVKMIFPLGMCILPALFIVILGPAFIQIRDIF